jgi:hypothetical protein
MKIVIKESQYNFLVEQTTTQTILTPAEQKKQEYLKKREEQKKANAARLAPIESAQKKRIDNWVVSNPGQEGESYEDGVKRYWKDVEKRQSGPDAELPGMEGQVNKRGGSCGAATSLQKSLNR